MVSGSVHHGGSVCAHFDAHILVFGLYDSYIVSALNDNSDGGFLFPDNSSTCPSFLAKLVQQSTLTIKLYC